MATIMKCGHSANGLTHPEKKPCCVICAPNPDAYETAYPPDLTGRKARCSCCKKEVESSLDLAFFEYKPDREYDLYYDGCLGWN